MRRSVIIAVVVGFCIGTITIILAIVGLGSPQVGGPSSSKESTSPSDPATSEQPRVASGAAPGCDHERELAQLRDRVRILERMLDENKDRGETGEETSASKILELERELWETAYDRDRLENEVDSLSKRLLGPDESYSAFVAKFGLEYNEDSKLRHEIVESYRIPWFKESSFHRVEHLTDEIREIYVDYSAAKSEYASLREIGDPKQDEFWKKRNALSDQLVLKVINALGFTHPFVEPFLFEISPEHPVIQEAIRVLGPEDPVAKKLLEQL